MGNGVTVSNTASVIQQQIIDSLTEKLKKSNERVRELEERCSSHEKDMLRQCVFMEKTAEKIERHREWQATANVLRRPTREAKQALNKFALERKIEALDDLLEEIQCSVVVPKRYEQLQEPYLEGIKHCIQFIECQLEQLRKGQQ
tara:strand:- start:14257 stop:14691 length:435 start_codon:yes stop_codon:yes gene_type:complete